MVSPNPSRNSICLGALCLAMAFFSEISKIYGQEAAIPTAEELAKANFTYKIITTEGGGYGYDVFADGKRLIHQPTIPGQPGVSGFKNKSDSEKVAKLVIRKLKNKEIPPAVTEEELRSLKVIE